MSKHAKKSKSSEPEKINKDEIISESGEEKESVKESEDTAEEKAEEKAEEPEEVTAEEPEAEPEEKTEESADEEAGNSEESEDEADEEAEEASDEVSEEKADAPLVYIGGADEKTKKANAEFRKLSFGEKCKKDPLIPVSLLFIFIAIIVAAAYFILPNRLTPSMGMTLSEFRSRFDAAEISKNLLNNGLDMGFIGVDYVDPASNPSILGDKVVVSANSSYVDFFTGEARSYLVDSGIEGATRKNDEELAYVRIYVKYEEDVNPIWMYFSNILMTLYPDYSMNDAMDVAIKLLGEYNGDTGYDFRGDYAFRMVPVTRNETNYIVFDVVPRAALNDSQIRYDLDANEKFARPAASEAAESVAETTVEATAST